MRRRNSPVVWIFPVRSDAGHRRGVKGGWTSWVLSALSAVRRQTFPAELFLVGTFGGNPSWALMDHSTIKEQIAVFCE